jgi:hypothetical protein
MKTKLLLLIALIVSSTSVFAQSYEFKDARPSDNASRYATGTDGSFFREVNGDWCKIFSSGLKSYKVSLHPEDVATAYVLGNSGTLYYVKDQSSCYLTENDGVSKIAYDVNKYSVVPNENSEYVNFALADYSDYSETGTLMAWKNSGSPLKWYNIEKYSINNCYKRSGKSFSSYIAFAITSSGRIIKIKNTGADKADQTKYSSLKEFTKTTCK